MKRIVTSIGVAALGAACVQSATAQDERAKPFSASVALRGFYDDNLNTASTGEVDTFGGEVNPRIGFSLDLDQTTANFIYTYGYTYYDEKPQGNTEHYDQTHTIAANLMHAFSERTSLAVSDSFVIGQEPDMLRPGLGADSATFQRISGQNMRNFGSLKLTHQFSPKIGMEAGYANTYFNYDDEVYQVNYYDGTPFLKDVNPVSNSGILDRIDQVANIDARWTIQPKTVGLVGYAFSMEHYTGDQPIGVINLGNPINLAERELTYSDDRDNQAHYLYAGVEHTFRPGFTGSLRVGARFTDYFNSPTDESSTSPYVLGSLNYQFSRDSSVQAGISHDLSATDAFSTQGDSFTTDSEVTVLYASFSHRILPRLTGYLMGQFQNSTLNGGDFDGDTEQSYVVSTSLSYEFNRHVATGVSYNYDLLDSDVPGRGFNRNRVYLSATFTY